MKEKSDFVKILEATTRRLLSAPGRFFAGDNSCEIPREKDIEIYQRAVFDMPLSGKKRVRFSSRGVIREEILHPGDILYTPAGYWKCTKWDLPHELFCFIVAENYLRYTYVDYRTVNADFHRPVCLDFFHTRQKPPALFHEQLRLLTECSTDFQQTPAAMLMTQALLNLGLESLYQDTLQPSAGKAQQTFQRLMQYLQANYMSDITRRDMAQHFQLNECYISRLFQEQCGKSFSEVLRNFRMSHASYLLRHTNMTVAEIAEQCGYSSLQTFTSVFHHYSGMPPVRYRISKNAGC